MPHKYTKELLEPIIKSSVTWSDVCRKLNIKPATGAQTHISKRSKVFNIDSSHFLGQSSTKGKKLKPRVLLEQYLNNEKHIKSDELRRRLITAGLKEEKCEICNNTEWNGEKIPLELDHKNSNHFDNRLCNLQVICSNCHALETRKRKHIKTLNAHKSSIKKDNSWRFNPRIKSRKVNRPSKEDLIELIKNYPIDRITKNLGLKSNNSVRKWCKLYDIDYKKLSPFSFKI